MAVGTLEHNNEPVELPVKVEVEGTAPYRVPCRLSDASPVCVFLFLQSCVLCRSISGLAIFLDYDVALGVGMGKGVPFRLFGTDLVVDSEGTVARTVVGRASGQLRRNLFGC